MENMELVVYLREKADLTYEEARDVLQEADWDLLQAMILLEQRGKLKRTEPAKKPEEAEAEKVLAPAAEKAESEQKEQQEKEAKSAKKGERRQRMRKMFARAKEILIHNAFVVERGGDTLVRMPAWVLALLLVLSWKLVVPVAIVALFFGLRYSFQGPDDLGKANDFLDKASDLADEMKESLA